MTDLRPAWSEVFAGDGPGAAPHVGVARPRDSGMGVR